MEIVMKGVRIIVSLFFLFLFCSCQSYENYSQDYASGTPVDISNGMIEKQGQGIGARYSYDNRQYTEKGLVEYFDSLILDHRTWSELVAYKRKKESFDKGALALGIGILGTLPVSFYGLGPDYSYGVFVLGFGSAAIVGAVSMLINVPDINDVISQFNDYIQQEQSKLDG